MFSVICLNLFLVRGRYAKGTSSDSRGGMNAIGGLGRMDGNGPPSGGMPSGGFPGGSNSGKSARAGNTLNANGEEVGTPESGSTQSSSSKTDSSNYSSYADMLEAYKSDIAEVTAGDEYGKNIVELYNPVNYIGDEDTDAPTWTRILCGASEGDISMFNSMNMPTT